MKRYLSIFSALALTMPLFAGVVTFKPNDFAGQGVSGGMHDGSSAISVTKDGVTFACNNGYGASSAVRCYKNSVVTITSEWNIFMIEFAFESANGHTYDGGLESSVTVDDHSWTYTLSASQARFTEIKVIEYVPIGNLYYGLNKTNKTAKVTTDGSSYYDSVIIPESITYESNTYSVTSIGYAAFYGCSSLTSVTIPNSVTSIGNSAFYGCSSLTSVTIPNSVTSIGEDAILNCSSLTSVTLNSNTIASATYSSSLNIKSIFGEQVREYILGDDITSIGRYAFSGCTSLTSVSIGNGVTSIGNSAFYGCDGLTSIVWNAKNCNDFSSAPFSSSITSFTFGENVEHIPAYLCNGMSNLTSITIPESVTSIGESAFSGCNNIKHIALNSNAIASKTYSTSDNLCSLFGSQVQTYALGDSVTNIGDYAFYGGSNISSIDIPNSIVGIGSSAFYGCSGITSFDIPEGVTAVQPNTFFGCSGLQSITIPSSVVSIGNEGFGNCSQLLQVTINSNALVSKAYSPTNNFANIFGPQVQTYTLGDAITSIGDYAFSGCNNISALNIPNNVTQIGNGSFQNCTGVESFNIPESVISIGNHAFYGCSGISSVVVPNATSIGNSSFGDCSNINSVQFDNGLVSIGDSAFSSCYNLAAIQFPSSLHSIGNYAFYQCNRIPSVEIAGNITSLGEGAFKGCSRLTQVSVNSNAVISKAYSATNNFATIFGQQVSAYTLGDAITAIGDYVFCGNNISALTIPSSVTHIGKSAFQGCSAISNITIPEAVTTIENKTFQGCTSLTSITMPDAITAIKDSAFINCSSLVISSFPSSLTTLGSSAFAGCSSISAITFPATLKTVGENAFANCIGVARVDISDLAAWCATDFANSQSNPLYYARNLYLNNDLVSELVIPNRITELKNWAFNNCSSITSVVIPNTVRAISPTAFSGCGNIASVEWHSKNVTDYASLDQAPFYTSRKKVTEFVFGEEVEHVPAYLCDGMSNITSLTFPSYLKSIGDYAFKDLTKIRQINVPNEVTAIGTHAFDSCIFVTSIYLGYQVAEIGDYAFKGCIRVNDITSMNTTTPVAYDNTLTSISQYAYLYVQAGSKRTYQLDPYWSRFDIQEVASEDATLTRDAVTVEANVDNALFTWPVCDTAAYYSLQITKDEVVFCTLMFNSSGQLTGIAFAPGRNGNAHAPAATLSVAGMSFTVTGLNSASKYAYRLAVLNEDNVELVAYGGEFATTGYTGEITPGGEPIITAVDNTTPDAQQTTKVIRNGQLFILRDGKTYNLQGQEVK